MKSSHKAILLMMLVTTLGVWGCADSGTSPRATARIRHLESRNTKLEEDYQATVDECIALRQRLSDTVKLCKHLQLKQRQFELVTKERDDLKQRINVFAGERDALQTQLVRFSRELQNLAGKVQQVANTRNGGVMASTVSMKTEK